MRIAFIGLGKLGMPCAEALAKKGYSNIAGYDVLQKHSDLVDIKSTLADAIKDRDVVFIATPTPHEEGYDGREPTSHKQPKDLISKTGNEVLDIPEGHLCCGSAGTYNILHQKMAKTLLNNKVKNIEKISPDFISTGNIGCMTQISAGTRIPIIHTVELLDWFTGGPKPYKLDNF